VTRVAVLHRRALHAFSLVFIADEACGRALGIADARPLFGYALVGVTFVALGAVGVDEALFALLVIRVAVEFAAVVVTLAIHVRHVRFGLKSIRHSVTAGDASDGRITALDGRHRLLC